MIGPVATSSANVVASWSAVAANADCAVADNSRNLAGELAVQSTDRNRDDADAMGHRATELRPCAA